ncbi:hypothetical protein A8C56_04830 [Niabella ginsenosidivorans]|uniref:Right handed beta helix domain-containing protein n=1 Tax=Niabella ginsenosidivorans TaxID=1176587 RepID=A0A1A9HYC9_9BACT|nr:DUF6519 domain-containing protein [Niabella ginsenosidivorans]ANH80397.1 hypothetical protein A8C56_04830 [Niabella ginsenosidivorans]
MPGDFSRKLFNSKKHYSAVLEQQGRVQLDADWNEQVDIQQYRTHTEAKDVIGLTGVPKKPGGFAISVLQNGSDLGIAAGRIYVDGLLFELEAGGATSYLHQPHYRSPDLSFFNPPSSPLSPPASPPVAALKNGTYIVYLKGWQQEVNFWDDPQIQEVALGEADTTVRLKNLWQVRLLPVSAINSASTCTTVFPEWDSLVARPTGTLNVQAVQNTAVQQPCVLPPSSGFTGLENQLYRVQILKSGDRNTARYIWARNNASIETSIIKVSGSVAQVADTGKDEVLGFTNGQWVQIVETEPTIDGNQLVQIESVDIATGAITFKTSIVQYETKSGLKLRRWDVQGTAMENGISMQNGWVNLENGIRLSFSAGTYNEGDYWLIPARTATAGIEWPVDSAKNPVPMAPSGIRRHYCRLALIVVQNGQLSSTDCRPLFPSLTEICAEDICFNSNTCNFPSNIKNVQQALDQLCQKTGGGLCTYVAKPGNGWEAVFESVKAGMDAQICLPAGQYPLEKPVTVSGKGNLRLVGSGLATSILSPKAEAAVLFDKCSSVTITDLHAEGGTASPNDKSLVKGLNGIFNFTGCSSVTMHHVSLKTGSGTLRSCTGITVKGTTELPTAVRIEDCDLSVGGWQQGILVVNTGACYIERNTISTYVSDNNPGLSRAAIKDLLVSNIHEGVIGRTKGSGANNVTITSGNFTVNFRTDPSLKGDWQRAMTASYPAPARSVMELQKRISDLALKLITDKRLQDAYVNIAALIKSVVAAATAGTIAAQGITIGGQTGKDLFINNNIISNVLQGVHVGVSHRTATRNPDTLGNVSITGNSISVFLPRVLGKQDRYGIFIGNCKNALVENNTLYINRSAGNTSAIDGIRVWGILGPRLMITKNFAGAADGNQKSSFDIGININPLQQKPSNAQWVVLWNVVPSKAVSVQVKNGAVSVAGTNTP